MLGLREKDKCVVVLRPSVLFTETVGVKPPGVATIEELLAEADLDIVKRKTCFLSDDECKPYCQEGGGVDVGRLFPIGGGERLCIFSAALQRHSMLIRGDSENDSVPTILEPGCVLGVWVFGVLEGVAVRSPLESRAVIFGFLGDSAEPLSPRDPDADVRGLRGPYGQGRHAFMNRGATSYLMHASILTVLTVRTHPAHTLVSFVIPTTSSRAGCPKTELFCFSVSH